MSWLDKFIFGLQILTGGTPVTQRPKLNFVSGATVVDNPTTSSTDVTITGSGSGTIQGDYTQVACAPLNTVYFDGAGAVNKAQADNIATMPAAGIVTAVVGPIATVVHYGRVGGFVGLTPGATYYVGKDFAGQYTATAPVAPGEFVQEIGVAISATDMMVMFTRKFIGPL